MINNGGIKNAPLGDKLLNKNILSVLILLFLSFKMGFFWNTGLLLGRRKQTSCLGIIEFDIRSDLISLLH